MPPSKTTGRPLAQVMAQERLERMRQLRDELGPFEASLERVAEVAADLGHVDMADACAEAKLAVFELQRAYGRAYVRDKNAYMDSVIATDSTTHLKRRARTA